jgi:hypothetical protein
MHCTVDEAKAYFTAAHQAEIERTQRLIELLEADLAQLERELAELTAPKPIFQPKPRKK